MIIATFAPSTGWAGRTISFESGQFLLEGHGPIAATDVMEYDRQGHLVWANAGTRAWIGAKAAAQRPSPRLQVADARPRARRPGAGAGEPAVSAPATARAATGESPDATVPVSTRPPWWRRPHIVIALVAGGALAALLLALGLAVLPSELTPQEIYERNVGSVVQIQTTFPEAFDAYGQPTGGGEGVGTGFVVAEDGYIVTNAHVVSENGQAVNTVRVVFKGGESGGRTIAGTVVSADESTDVALIRVDPGQAPELVPIPLGDSSKATVGEVVVAIGNPFGLDSSLSLGVVSATDRDLESPSGATIRGGIQTDAAINPGSSGGPLIDSTGHVIGINEQIDTFSGGNEGIGFAVPINTAADVIEQMMEADRSAQ